MGVDREGLKVCAWRAPKGSDLRVLEHGSNCLATVDADVVVGETTSDSRSGGGERAGVSMGIDTKANTRAAAHSRLVICVNLRMEASAEAPWTPMLLPSRLRARGGVGMVRE